MFDAGQIDLSISDLRSGDPARLAAFWKLYGPLLEKVAARKMSAGVKRRLGAEDVAQSACRSFLRRAADGQFQIDDADGLWRLLCAITLTKVKEKTRFHLRKKRSLAAEAGEADDRNASDTDDPAMVAEFNDTLNSVLESLDDEARQILELRLANHTQEEIAEILGCSERTVRRILKKMQAEFESLAA